MTRINDAMIMIDTGNRRIYLCVRRSGVYIEGVSTEDVCVLLSIISHIVFFNFLPIADCHNNKKC